MGPVQHKRQTTLSTESDDYDNWKSAIQNATKGQFLFLAWPTNMREVNSQVIQISREAAKGPCKQND